MKRRVMWGVLFLLVTAMPGNAETLRADADWWASGSGDGITIDQQGRLTLARELRRTVDLDAGAVWDLSWGDGTLWVAWSDPGRLMSQDGKIVRTVVSLDDDHWISALALDSAGEPWYAVSPGGLLRRGTNPDDGWSREIGAAFIWDLLALPGGGLVIATGEPGFVALWDGKLSKVLSLPEQESARTLAPGIDGVVWIGTATTGQLWRWNHRSEPFLVGQLPDREIIALTADATGGVWILHTSSAAEVRTNGTPQDLPPGYSLPASAKRVTIKTSPNASQPDPITEGSGAAKMPGERGIVISHWTEPGGFREIWRRNGETPYAMVLHEGDLWVGSGPAGQLRRIRPDGRVVEAYALPGQNVSALAFGSPGVLAIGTAKDGTLHRLAVERRGEGIWTGPVIDARAPAQWGRLDAHLEGDARLEVRVGNIKIPGTGWTAWTPVDAMTAATLPLARWGQLRVQLALRAKKTAAVSEVAWTYAVRNRAPHIREMHVEPAGTIWFAGTQPGRSPGGPVIIEDRVATDSATRFRSKARSVVKRAYEQGTQTIVWTAEDPDGDSLRATLTLVTPAGRRVELYDGESEGFHSFDARPLPEGQYLIELKVEDPSGARETREGAKFFLDHTAPMIETERSSTGWKIVVRDAEGLRAVDYRQGQRWLPMAPLDGLVEERVERFEWVDSSRSEPVWIRAIDRSGNVSGVWVGGKGKDSVEK